MNNSTDKQIKELRDEIDDINLRIVDLLSQRGTITAKIGKIKAKSNGVQFYNPKREKEQLDAISQHNNGPFSNDVLCKIFKEIFKASLDLEEKKEQKKLLVSKFSKIEKTIIKLKNISIGEKNQAIIAGPCAIESIEQMTKSAEILSKEGIKILRGGAYKPRTSPYDFQGLGLEGLKIGRKTSDLYNLSFITEVLDTRDVEIVAEYADIIQIGARNMHNFALLKEIGKINKPVMLKRGLSASIEEWLYAAEYIISNGNDQIILCERGIRTYEKWTRNTLDLSAVALAKQESHLPVIVDITHGTGRKDLLIPLAKAALAVGADGIHIEIHPDPKIALSDNEQQMNFDEFKIFMQEINKFLN